MVTETFGSTLYIPESEKFEELPNPDSLKYRILISTKPPKEYLEAKDDKRSSSQKSQVSDVDDDAWSDDKSFKVWSTTETHSDIYISLLSKNYNDSDITRLYVAVRK